MEIEREEKEMWKKKWQSNEKEVNGGGGKRCNGIKAPSYQKKKKEKWGVTRSEG